MKTKKPVLMNRGHSDSMQTPTYALKPLLEYIPKHYTIWECAMGKGNLLFEFERLGYATIGTDITVGIDFLKPTPPIEFDCIVTNPPYNIKDKFIARCYEIGKPWALLMPLTALESKFRQELYSKYGLQIILMNKRINFETPSGQGSGSWFATAWFTNGFNLPNDIMYFKF